MRIVFMGTPTFILPVVDALLSIGSQVVGIYTQPDKPSGRGRGLESPPAKQFGLANGIRVFQPTSLRGTDAEAELASLRPDVIVVAAYGKLLPPEVLDTPPYGCLNLHPSLLPRYRGPSPVATTILDGERRTGMSIMLLDQGMDTGAVLAQKAFPISPDATTGTLTEALFEMGAELIKEVLPGWTRGDLTAQPQDHNRATITKKLEKGDGEVVWDLSAQELERRLRAFTPWPGLFTHWRGKMVKILSASVLPLPGDLTGPDVGLVLPVRDSGLAIGVVTGDGVLGIGSLQMEGKRPLTSAEFLRGQGDFLGARLPS